MTNVVILVRGKPMCISEAAETLGVNYFALRNRVRKMHDKGQKVSL